MTTLKGNTQSMHWGVGCDLDQSAINGGEGSVGWGGVVGVLVGGWGPKTNGKASIPESNSRVNTQLRWPRGVC